MKIFIPLIVLTLTACTNNKLQLQSTSMEGTIKKGEYVEIVETENINHGDIIAFKHLDKTQKEQLWIFRVIGKAGDNVEIKNGEVFVNNQKTQDLEHLKYSYRANTKNALSKDELDSYEGFEISPNEYLLHLTDHQINEIDKNPNVLEITKKIHEVSENQNNLFYPDSKTESWSIDNYGPIQIPVNEDSLYFVLGDNRHNALDSRFIGFIKKSQVLGVVI